MTSQGENPSDSHREGESLRGKKWVRIELPPSLKDLFDATQIGPHQKRSYTGFVMQAIEDHLPRIEDSFADRSTMRPSNEGFAAFRIELESRLYFRVQNLSLARKKFEKQKRGAEKHYSAIKSIFEEVIARKFATDWEQLGLDKNCIAGATGYEAAVAGGMLQPVQ